MSIYNLSLRVPNNFYYIPNAEKQGRCQEKFGQTEREEQAARPEDGKEDCPVHNGSQAKIQARKDCIEGDQKVPEIDWAAHTKGSFPAQR